MKLRKFLYLYLALWLAFPCIVIIIWMMNYNLLIGTTGTAFRIQDILNCIAAVCGISQKLWGEIKMGHIFSVEEATQKLFTRLSEATGWKYLKSQQCLKKPVKDLVFQINFFTSKWNVSYERVEVGAEFKLWCKSYGKLPANNVIAMMSYCPECCTSDSEHWYDISTEEKLLSAFDELNRQIQQTAGSLCAQFEQDYLGGVEILLWEHFDEYRVYLDFIADKLDMSPAIREKAQEIYDNLSDDMRQQVLAYQNGARNSVWMINRSNLKYIVDNNLIALIPSD